VVSQLILCNGAPNHSIAKQLGRSDIQPHRVENGLSRPTVIAARARFGTGGVQALTAKPTQNRPRQTLTPEVEKKIVDTTLKTRPPDATQWTVRTLGISSPRCPMSLHAGIAHVRFDPDPFNTFTLSS
jgi:hypothetical protein